MAVQAQYPSNFLLLNRGEQERKEMDSSPKAATGFLGQPAVFVTDRADGNARKRRWDAAGDPSSTAPPQQSHPANFISLQPQPWSPPLVSLTQLQTHPAPLVSTALGLTSEEKQHLGSPKQSNLSGELAAQINRQRDEIEHFLLAQEEQLRRALAERRQRHYRALLSAAEESASRRLRQKDGEVERLARRRAELEDRLARLRTEAMAWQAKAMADQATAAALNTQLQQASAAAAAPPTPGTGDACGDPPPAEVAESAYVDPERVERERGCRWCRWRRASVVLLPCRHLCLCDGCEAASESCPVCQGVRSGSVRVLLS